METWEFVLAFLVLATVTIVSLGLTVVKQNTAAVVERFGKFKKVWLPGLHVLILPGIVDKLTVSKNGHDRVFILQRMGEDVFAEGGALDYKDDSAVTRAKLWFTVGNTAADNPADWDIKTETGRDNICKAVYQYVYAAQDSKERGRSLVDQELRGKLQDMTVDQALTKKTDVASEIDNPTMRERLSTNFNPIGLYLLPKGEDLVTIGDIILSAQSETLRRKVLEETKLAEARVKAAAGTRRALEVISKGEDGSGAELPINEAARIQQRIQAMDALKEAKVSIVTSSAGAALNALLEIADQKGERA